MKKESPVKHDQMRREYDLSKLKGGVRGEYYERAVAGMNIALIEPDLAELFPNSESVNQRFEFWPTPPVWRPLRSVAARVERD